jgi:NTF2-related export protein 1/2
LDSGVLVWNGNATVGKDLIQKFFEVLPPSEHTLTALDSQPVLGKYLHSIL